MMRINLIVCFLLLSLSSYAEEHSLTIARKTITAKNHTGDPLLTVHEWGTITTKHNVDGGAVGYLNRIRPEETLPEFVYKLDQSLTELKVFSKGVTSESDSSQGDSAGFGHPDVTMRLETPVIYFYPSSSFDNSQTIDVNVEFHGGLINEYYPNAEVTYENLSKSAAGGQTHLTETTVGKLSWKNIKFDDSGSGRQTDFNVWLAPRNTKSSFVRLPKGEGEKYLFYRGVAHLPNVFRTTHDMDTKVVSLWNPIGMPWTKEGNVQIDDIWVVSVRSDGKVAERGFQQPIVLSHDVNKSLNNVSLNFTEDQYSEQNFKDLWNMIHLALVAHGLYEEEATAMLKTWENFYFKDPGTRILFLVPREWIDYYLPLKFSIPVKLERVMIGRIDLVL